VAEDVDVRAGHGLDDAAGHLGPLHAQLGVDARHHDVELGQQLLVLVERAVGQDVDLDAREDAERRQALVERPHLVELAAQALGREAPGDGEAGRVVGEHHVLVAEAHGRPGHRLDGGAAVGPRRVQVAVALERRPQLGTRTQGDLGVLLERGDVLGDPAGECLLDDRAGLGADARQVGEPAGGGQPGDLVVAHLAHDVARPGVGLDLLRGLERPVEQVDDAVEGVGGVHAVETSGGV
jgi:hypothetical protein